MDGKGALRLTVRVVYLTGTPTAYSFLPALILGRGAFAAVELALPSITPWAPKVKPREHSSTGTTPRCDPELGGRSQHPGRSMGATLQYDDHIRTKLHG